MFLNEMSHSPINGRLLKVEIVSLLFHLLLVHFFYTNFDYAHIPSITSLVGLNTVTETMVFLHMFTTAGSIAAEAHGLFKARKRRLTCLCQMGDKTVAGPLLGVGCCLHVKEPRSRAAGSLLSKVNG